VSRLYLHLVEINQRRKPRLNWGFLFYIMGNVVLWVGLIALITLAINSLR
jgi:hypothetical protein